MDPEPPADFMKYFRAAIRSDEARADTMKNVAAEMRCVTTNADTHPCLNDRLSSLGTEGKILTPALAQPSAIQILLAPSEESILRDVNKLWREELSKIWKARHKKNAVVQQQLGDLTHGNRASDVDALWDQVRLKLEMDDDLAAEPLLRQILELQANHFQALLALGIGLLNRDDQEGLKPLEQAMREEVGCVPQACQALINYHRRSGNLDGIKQVEARLDRYEKMAAASRDERSSVSHKDTLISHGLSQAEMTTLLAALAAFPEITGAFIGRKQLQHFTKQPMYLLCVQVGRSWWSDQEKEQAVVSKLSRSPILPGRTFVFAPRGNFRSLARKLEQLPEARLKRP